MAAWRKSRLPLGATRPPGEGDERGQRWGRRRPQPGACPHSAPAAVIVASHWPAACDPPAESKMGNTAPIQRRLNAWNEPHLGTIAFSRRTSIQQPGSPLIPTIMEVGARRNKVSPHPSHQLSQPHSSGCPLRPPRPSVAFASLQAGSSLKNLSHSSCKASYSSLIALGPSSYNSPSLTISYYHSHCAISC